MASKADTWMPLYIADYLRKTMHLNRDQHGGYMLLLMACWDRGGRLPNDAGQLAGIARATPAEWKKLAPVLLPFFEVEGGNLTQGRVVEEHEKAARLSQARREAGRQGGRPRKQLESDDESEPKPIGFENQNQTETPTRVASPSPITSPSENSEPNGSGGEPPAAECDDLAELRALELRSGSWRLAVKLLMSRGGYPESRARTLVGKWAKEAAPVEIWQACEAAWKNATLDPVSYVTAALERIRSDGTDADALLRPTEARQRLWMEHFATQPQAWREHERGPKPGQPGCRVTPEIQREFGLEPAKPQPVRGAA